MSTDSKEFQELFHDAALINPRRPTRDPWYLALGGFLVAIVVAHHTVYYNGILPDDAFSRVVNAYYVFLRPHPHFAAIGFVWNPLPSLLEVPLTLLHQWWPSMVTKGFAGNIVSAAFYGVGLANLYRALHWLGVRRAVRWTWVILYALNPMILWYGANGMTDGMLAATLLGMSEGLLAFFESDDVSDLTRAGIWLSVGFLLRYEAIPVGAMAGLGLIVALARRGRSHAYIEAMLLVFELPMVYMVGIWMFTNWLIMKNPLYFLLSPYGNMSSIGTGVYRNRMTEYAFHNVEHSVWLSLHWMVIFVPVVVGLVGVLVTDIRGRRAGLPLLGAAMGAPVLQMVMLYAGKSADWDRFFLYYIPFGFLLLAVSAASPIVSRFRVAAVVVTTLSLIAGNWSTWNAMGSSRWGRGDSGYVTQIVSGKRTHGIVYDEQIAMYVNNHPHLKILIDTFTSFAIVPYVKRPDQIVMTADLNFQGSLMNPLGQVNAFLVPQPTGVGKLNAINRAYPAMWAGKVPWVRRVASFSGSPNYRLYAILPDAP